MHRTLIVFTLACLVPFAARAEKYIVPVFGEVRGGQHHWRSNLLVGNPSASPASLVVSTVGDFGGAACPEPVVILVPARSSTVMDWLEFPCAVSGQVVALELEGPAGLHVQPIVFAAGPGETKTQLVQVAEQWIPVGETGVIFDAFPVSDRQRTNLFLVNPNPWPIEVSYGTAYGGSGSARVEARSVQMVPLPPNFGCPPGCGTGALARFHGIDLQLAADGEFLAALSYPASDRHPMVWVSRVLE